jgi:hypothetical protein
MRHPPFRRGMISLRKNGILLQNTVVHFIHERVGGGVLQAEVDVSSILFFSGDSCRPLGLLMGEASLPQESAGGGGEVRLLVFKV